MPMNTNKTVVIALGGNALLDPKTNGSIIEQIRTIEQSCQRIAQIIARGYRVVLTHGNGPQVGNLLIQQEEAKELVPPLPLDVCDAMTQGQLGYLIQQKLREALGQLGIITQSVVTVVTQVQVDPGDPAFADPTKPIGPFYSDRERLLLEQKGYVLKRVGKGAKPWRRVVASPEPKDIVELGAIRALLATGSVVIACGGGGVPVVREGGRLHGVEAVIDKDLASALLASELGAQILLILTNVERVALHFGTPQQVFLDRMSVREARRYLIEGHFPAGSMGPKVEAAIRFVEGGGERAYITSLEKALEALEGRAGTEVYA
ncbi:MAG: carbamate kinase [Candidatus Bipolaricaulota bacterium]|nr:carbamate kinase [Candidatus Bipolaricaulota bacterium]MDW8030825.1 carbamate kinase [Candidatus Bipolaricaulota bacterium]